LARSSLNLDLYRVHYLYACNSWSIFIFQWV